LGGCPVVKPCPGQKKNTPTFWERRGGEGARSKKPGRRFGKGGKNPRNRALLKKPVTRKARGGGEPETRTVVFDLVCRKEGRRMSKSLSRKPGGETVPPF